jgi:hypothetical protein
LTSQRAGRSILEDLRLAEEAGMMFPEAAEEVEAEVTSYIESVR